jgi:hypothetical protein
VAAYAFITLADALGVVSKSTVGHCESVRNRPQGGERRAD